MPVIVGIAVGIAVAGIALALYARLLPLPRVSGRPRAVVAVAMVALGGAGLFAQQYSLRHRYRSAQPLPAIYKWAQDVHDTRIAIVGFQLQYPLYGKDLSNHVQYLAERAGNGKSVPITDCRSWRRAVNEGGYEYVVTTSPSFPFQSRARAVETAWTRSDPAAKLLLVDSHGDAHAWLFEIRGRMDADGCTDRA